MSKFKAAWHALYYSKKRAINTEKLEDFQHKVSYKWHKFQALYPLVSLITFSILVVVFLLTLIFLVVISAVYLWPIWVLVWIAFILFFLYAQLRPFLKEWKHEGESRILYEASYRQHQHNKPPK